MEWESRRGKGNGALFNIQEKDDTVMVYPWVAFYGLFRQEADIATLSLPFRAFSTPSSRRRTQTPVLWVRAGIKRDATIDTEWFRLVSVVRLTMGSFEPFVHFCRSRRLPAVFRAIVMHLDRENHSAILEKELERGSLFSM